MRKYLRIAYFALIGVVMMSCVTQRRCQQKFPVKPEIIVETTTIIKDTIIYRTRFVTHFDTVYADTVIREVKIRPNMKPVYAEVAFASALCMIVNNKLRLELVQKDSVLQTIIEVQEKEVLHWKEMYLNKTETIVREVKFIPKIYKISLFIVIGLIVGFVGYLIVKLRF